MNSVRRLIFRWPERNVSFLFPLFFLLALLLHAAGLLLFQVVYPPSENANIAPPGKVTFVSPTTKEGRAFLQWVEAQNPVSAVAPLLEARLNRPQELAQIEYIPSYASVRTLPKTVESLLSGATPFPSARSTTALLRPSSPQRSGQQSNPAAHPPLPTRLTYSEPLQSRIPPLEALATRPTPMPSSAAANPSLALPPTTFLIAVDPAGQPLYLFLQASSGNSLLDIEAEKHLSKQQFTPAPNPSDPETWGYATYTWGADTLRPPAKEDKTEATHPIAPHPAKEELSL